MTPRPITSEDCDALMRQRPKMIGQGEVDGRRWWLVRYEGFPDPLLDVWATGDWVFKPTHVWFPGAGSKSVPAWVATLPEPVAVKPKTSKTQAETGVAS